MAVMSGNSNIKSEEEKSLRGTTTLYKDPSLGLIVYVRGKKIFKREASSTWNPISQIDAIEAAYKIRREYAACVEEGRASEVTIFAPFRRCKSAAEMSLKLERMLVKK